MCTSANVKRDKEENFPKAGEIHSKQCFVVPRVTFRGRDNKERLSQSLHAYTWWRHQMETFSALLDKNTVRS